MEGGKGGKICNRIINKIYLKIKYFIFFAIMVTFQEENGSNEERLVHSLDLGIGYTTVSAL